MPDTLWDPIAAREAREEAINTLTHFDWRAAARDALYRVACRQQYLMADDIWAELIRASVTPPAEPRAMAQVTRKGVAEGWIQNIGSATSLRRAGLATVYRSLLWRLAE